LVLTGVAETSITAAIAGPVSEIASRRGGGAVRNFVLTLVLGRGAFALALHAGQSLGNLAEQGLDVVASLGRGLDEHNVELLGLSLGLVSRHLALVVEVRLVADEDNDHVRAALRAHVVDPLSRVQE